MASNKISTKKVNFKTELFNTFGKSVDDKNYRANIAQHIIGISLGGLVLGLYMWLSTYINDPETVEEIIIEVDSVEE